MTLETALAFFGIAVLLAATPGPDNLFVLMHAAVHGPRAGMAIVFGLCTGLIAHTTAVALGLSAILAASPAAFTALTVAGALYLAILAWQSFKAASSPATEPAAARGSARRMYVRGIAMNLGNPKVLLFFLAFLPQFVHAERGRVGLQIAALGGLFIAATLLVFGAVACGAGAIGRLLQRSPRVRRTLDRIAGCVFLALALRLVLHPLPA